MDAAADMWSLGVVLFFLCYARLPYPQVEDVDRLRQDIIAFDMDKCVFADVILLVSRFSCLF